MSLPPYDPSQEYGEYPEEKGKPPKYEAQIGLLNGSNLIEKEIIFCNLTWSSDVLCFTSSDAFTKYKSFRKIKEGAANFKHVINLQQLGIGLPLMEAQFNQMPGFGNTKFATIYKCFAPSPDSNRAFNKKTDKFKFCTIRKKRGTHYSRYTFTILPNQDNLSDTFEFSIFLHNKLPITDVTQIRGNSNRYRWVRSGLKGLSEDFTYTLYSLDEMQNSMVDNMDTKNQKLDKNNPLVDSKFGDLLKFSKSKIDSLYLSKDKLGELTRLEDRLTMSTLQEGNKLLLHVPQPQDMNLESIDSASLDELIIISMSYVLNRIEEIRIQAARVAVSS